MAQAQAKGQMAAGPVRAELFQEEAERALAEQFAQTRELAGPLLAARRYGEALEAMAGLRPAVDRFFDEVLVMAPEPEVRANRLSLLGEMAAFFSQICDWRQVVEG